MDSFDQRTDAGWFRGGYSVDFSLLPIHKPLSFLMSEYNTTKRNGFTLIELVVVVSVLAIVGVMVIPSLRTLNEDRKVRDTARVVGAVFAAARERATVDGQAGVEILSLPNASGTYNLPNMGLVLYQLRSIPPYGGDTYGAACRYDSSTPPSAANRLVINNFTGSDLVQAGVRINDSIELNNSGVKLPIVDLSPTSMEVEYLAPNPLIPANVALPYKIYRQPVRIESSAIRLPNRLFLNLAFSGYSVDGAEMNLINPSVNDPNDLGYNIPMQVWFGSDGSITRVFDRNQAAMVRANSPVTFLMCSGNRDSTDLTNLANTDFLRDDNSMWITIDNRTGGVTTGRMAQITDLSAPLADQIREARLLARDRRSATP